MREAYGEPRRGAARAATDRDARTAARSQAVLLLLGAVLLATAALPQEDAPTLGEALVVGGIAYAAGLVLLALDRADRVSLNVVYVFNLGSVLLIAALVAVSGGRESLYAEYYAFPLLHAAAFQSRARVAGMVALTLALFLAPLAYDGTDGAFLTIAAISIPPTIVAVLAVGAAMELLRAQRRVLERREARALALADQDPLTGLANYRVFRRELGAAVHAGLPLTLVLLDLDGFKAVNDRAGHRAGDALLRDVGARLRDVLRADDVLCRQGGDEFAVIAPRAGPEEAPELAERLVEAVERAGGGGRLSAAAGWATFGTDATTATGLIEYADAAMRAAKRAPQRKTA